MSEKNESQNMNFAAFFDAQPVYAVIDRKDCRMGYSFLQANQAGHYVLMYRQNMRSDAYEVSLELTPRCLEQILWKIGTFAPVNQILKWRQRQQQN